MPRRPSPRTLSVVTNVMTHYLAGGGSAVVQGVTTTSDNAGGAMESITVRGTVAVFMRPERVGGQIDVAGQAASEKQNYLMSLGTTVAIALTDRIIYGGGTYEVRDIPYSTGITWTPMQTIQVVKLT